MVSCADNKTEQRSVSIFHPRYRKQLLAAITVQFLTFAHGIVTGWISPTLLFLQSPDSPTNFIISIEQASWIGSFFGLGGMVGNVFFGLVINRIGRKICMFLIALPYITAWILIYFSKSYVYLYLARFLNGMTGGGNYIVVPIFISEISDPSVRGALSSMAMLYLSFGMVAGLLLSSYVNYYLNPCIILILPAIYLVVITRFPETPQHLLRTQKIEQAFESFRFYKNLPKKTNNVEAATTKQQEVEVNAEFEVLKQNILSNGGQLESVTIKDFVNADALKAFGMILVLLGINQFSGSFAFFNYMSDIFALTGTDIHPNICTSVMGVMQSLGIFLTMMLSDRFGRKVLMLVSTAGMALGLTVFGLYVKYASAEMKLQYNWFPIAIMTFVVLTGSIGVLGLLFTLVVELLPAKIRSTGTCISMFCLSCIVFPVLKIFPLMMKTFGLDFVLFCCGGSCVVGWFLVLLFLKETKGICLDK